MNNSTTNTNLLVQPDMLLSMSTITFREKQILKLIAKGFTDSEIGNKLFVSPYTVQTHRRNLIIKFRANNSCEVIFKACKMKII